MIGGAVGNRPELADAHTLATALAGIGIDHAYVFGAEHHRHRVCHRAAHGQAIGAIAVADARDKRRPEGPHGMTKAFPFVIAQRRERLFGTDPLQIGRVRPGQEAPIDTAQDFVEPTAVGLQGDPVAVTLLLAQRNVSTDTADAHDRTDHAEDPFHVFDRQDLAVMQLLHAGRDEFTEDTTHQSRRGVQPIESAGLGLQIVGVAEEVLDEPAPPQVAEQIIGVVLRLQIPFLPLAMLQAKLTHDRSLPFGHAIFPDADGTCNHGRT